MALNYEKIMAYRPDVRRASYDARECIPVERGEVAIDKGLARLR